MPDDTSFVVQTPLREAINTTPPDETIGAVGVTLSEHSDACTVELSPFQGRQSEFYAKVLSHYGLKLEEKSRVFSAGDHCFIWAGPGKWIAHTDRAADFVAGLETRLGDVAAVVDQSDGRCLLEIRGPRSRELLQKGIGIDLHPRQFDVGATAVTLVSGIGVQIWQRTDEPSYGLLVYRSMIGSFWKWLSVAGAEFGVQVTL